MQQGRKKAPSGTSSRVCEWLVAEGTGPPSNLLHVWASKPEASCAVPRILLCAGLRCLDHSSRMA